MSSHLPGWSPDSDGGAALPPAWGELGLRSAQVLESLASLRLADRSRPWEQVRGALLDAALDDERWVAARRAFTLGDDLVTVPRDLGTEFAGSELVRTHRDLYGQPWAPRDRVRRARLTMEGADRLLVVAWHPLLLVPLLAAAWAGAAHGMLGPEWGSVPVLFAVMLLPAGLLAGWLRGSVRGMSPAWRCAMLGLLLAVSLLPSWPLLAVLALGAMSSAASWLFLSARWARRPLMQRRRSPDLGEMDPHRLGELRACASSLGVELAPVGEADAVAAVVGLDAWCFALRARSVLQAPWFGTAAVDSAGCVLARAAGHGLPRQVLPGPVADAGSFPGLDRRLALWRAYADARGQCPQRVLAAVAQDLGSGLDDRVSMLARVLLQPE